MRSKQSHDVQGALRRQRQHPYNRHSALVGTVHGRGTARRCPGSASVDGTRVEFLEAPQAPTLLY
eukprot:4762304-Prymnesium_polylepis.1